MRLFTLRPVLALILFASTLLGLPCYGTPKNPTTVKQVEDRISKDVPIGSSRVEVEMWLKSQGIEYSYTNNTRHTSSVERAGLDPDKLSGLVQAIIRDTDRSFMVEGSICLYFFLDKNGRTVKHMVTHVGTGP
jgi:hypothetical protein